MFYDVLFRRITQYSLLKKMWITLNNSYYNHVIIKILILIYCYAASCSGRVHVTKTSLNLSIKVSSWDLGTFSINMIPSKWCSPRKYLDNLSRSKGSFNFKASSYNVYKSFQITFQTVPDLPSLPLQLCWEHFDALRERGVEEADWRLSDGHCHPSHLDE